MTRKLLIPLVAGACGLLGDVVSVVVASIFSATNGLDDRSDLLAFAVWTIPFTAVTGFTALATRSWALRPSPARWGIALALGVACGVSWTLAPLFALGGYALAFGFPIGLVWMIGGGAAMLSWTYLHTNNGLLFRYPAARISRRRLLLLGSLPMIPVVAGVSLVLGDMYVWGRAEPATHLIPAGFEGPVVILFNDPLGAPAERDGRRRIYRIPENGILRTQFPPNDGWSRPTYVYVDESGARSPIVTGAPCEDSLPGDPVQACLMPYLMVGDEMGTWTYESYVVSHQHNRSALYDRGDELVRELVVR